LTSGVITLHFLHLVFETADVTFEGRR